MNQTDFLIFCPPNNFLDMNKERRDIDKTTCSIGTKSVTDWKVLNNKISDNDNDEYGSAISRYNFNWYNQKNLCVTLRFIPEIVILWDKNILFILLNTFRYTKLYWRKHLNLFRHRTFLCNIVYKCKRYLMQARCYLNPKNQLPHFAWLQ